MMELLTDADFAEGEIEKINSLPALDILAIVSEKVWQKEHFGFVGSSQLMSKKKPLPFDLNLIPHTCRKPRTTPIDAGGLPPGRGMKKRKQERNDIDVKPPLVQPVLPPEYIQRIAELGGSNPELVIQKRLYKLDVVTNDSRLSMPYKKCKIDFGEVGKMKVQVIYKGVIDDNKLKEMTMNFKKWERVASYVLSGRWSELVAASGLKQGDQVEVWSFKVQNQLSFALVKKSSLFSSS